MEEKGDPDAPDGKREEWTSKVVLLSSPWRQGCAVTHLQANPQTSSDLKGFSNDKVEKQIVLQTDERSISTFLHFK